MLQRAPDHFGANGAELVLEVGPLAHDLLTQPMAAQVVGQQVGRGPSARAQPVLQSAFGTGNGRPDRPEGVIQVQGNGPDFKSVEHGGRE